MTKKDKTKLPHRDVFIQQGSYTNTRAQRNLYTEKHAHNKTFAVESGEERSDHEFASEVNDQVDVDDHVDHDGGQYHACIGDDTNFDDCGVGDGFDDDMISGDDHVENDNDVDDHVNHDDVDDRDNDNDADGHALTRMTFMICRNEAVSCAQGPQGSQTIIGREDVPLTSPTPFSHIIPF